MIESFLGIDVGGTASRWVAVTRGGDVQARGTAPGATGHLFAAVERERFDRTISDIGEALELPPMAVHAGVTGLGGPALVEARGIIASRLGVALEAVGASDDMALAYLATFGPGEGHLVSAGTGSIGLHLPIEGDPIRVGGRGLLIDDGGSGTWIALTALDRLYRRLDDSGMPQGAEILADALYGAIGGSSWDAVRGFVYGSDRGSIGSLAQAVAAAAMAGDAMATEILLDASSELARLARALLRRGGSLPVAFVGGVFALHPAIAQGLAEALPDVELRYPRVDAALHAAQMARTRWTGM